LELGLQRRLLRGWYWDIFVCDGGDGTFPRTDGWDSLRWLGLSGCFFST
jgi:hypothetical protein